MNLHLVVKYQFYAWNKSDKELVTLEEHQKVISEHGSCYWSRVSAISEKKLSILKQQIEEGEKTYVFLYEIQVPSSVHKDRVQWYRAELVNVIPGTPQDKKLIPEYYRESVKLEVAFQIKNIEKIKFDEGKTPKVPGQAAVRYASLNGSPVPSNLIRFGKETLLCEGTSSAISASTTDSEEPSYEPTEMDYKDELIYAQSKIIELQEEMQDLKEYKDKYEKILGMDYFFNSEKLLESWILENIHSISAELEIIDQQPSASWPDGKFGRMDLLAFNKESKDLVIIEVKTRKRRVKSGYDQFLRYTSWVKRNKKELESKYPAVNLQVSDSPDFVIITDYVNEEMKAICEDHGISLIQIFGGLGVDRVL